MPHTVMPLATLILVAVFTVGCSSSSVSPAGPSGEGGAAALSTAQLTGTWTLLSIQPAGQAEQTVPAGASYALTFADGRVSTKVDCNVCGGNLVVGEKTLTIGPVLACTRAACPTMAFENAYLAILAGDSSARIDGALLTLTSSRGVLHFRD